MNPFPELGIVLKQTALENGLILRVDPTWFALAPALVITEGEIDEMFDLLEQSLEDALQRVAAGHGPSLD